MKIKNHLAIIRNLRNISDAGVSKKHKDKIKQALKSKEWAKGNNKILPFQYITAAKMAPEFERELDQAMLNTLNQHQKLPGQTALLVDTSGSMRGALAGKSNTDRVEAASGLAILVEALCDDVDIYTFESMVHTCPRRRGMALRDAIARQPSGVTRLGKAVETMNKNHGDYDRLIVITDEQSHDPVPNPKQKHAYMINVGSNRNGVGYGKGWTAHIDGFSEATIDYVQELEQEFAEKLIQNVV